MEPISFYRIKDNRITQINRKMAHPGMNPFAFTINVEESAVTQDQKNLTTKYTVYYFAPRRQTHQRGKLHRHARPRRCVRPSRDQTDYYLRRWRSHGRTMTFKNHKLL